MVKIIAPNKQYTGLSAGVHFVNGIGETDEPHLIAWFGSKGYEVDDSVARETEQKAFEEAERLAEEEKANIEEGETVIPLSDLTNDQLKEKLDDLGIEYGAKDVKDVLIEKLNAANVELKE